MGALRLGKGSIINLIGYTFRRIKRQIEARFLNFDLSHYTPIVLAALASGSINLKEVEQFLLQRGYQFTQVEQAKMIEQGLIRIEDGNVYLCQKGKEVLSKLRDVLKDIEEKFTVGFS